MLNKNKKAAPISRDSFICFMEMFELFYDKFTTHNFAVFTVDFV